MMLTNLSKTINNTIKPNGKIIYLTLDGDLVKSAFDPPIRGFGTQKGFFKNNDGNDDHVNGKILYLTPKKNNTTESNVGYIQLVKDEGIPYLKTYLPNTIVSRTENDIQQEWLPRISDLLSLIPDSTLKFTYRTDKKYFQAPVDQIFSKLFSYGMIDVGISNYTLRNIYTIPTDVDPKQLLYNYQLNISNGTFKPRILPN
jgi:hypothetical protein